MAAWGSAAATEAPGSEKQAVAAAAAHQGWEVAAAAAHQDQAAAQAEPASQDQEAATAGPELAGSVATPGWAEAVALAAATDTRRRWCHSFA